MVKKTSQKPLQKIFFYKHDCQKSPSFLLLFNHISSFFIYISNAMDIRTFQIFKQYFQTHSLFTALFNFNSTDVIYTYNSVIYDTACDNQIFNEASNLS
jgi:hypothetical protein